MPLYEYACSNCGERFEKLQQFTSAPVALCESCGCEAGRILSVFSTQVRGGSVASLSGYAPSPAIGRGGCCGGGCACGH